MKRCLLFGLIAVVLNFCLGLPAWAFCGFYVAKADASLYNQASQVIIARDGDRTILTMANDYQGDVRDFALVVPIPVVIEASQVHPGDPAIIERLDGFSAPRLVEYFDPDPCTIQPTRPEALPQRRAGGTRGGALALDDEVLGVTIEAQFSVGEYDILILSATQSLGLETWLKRNDYRIPDGARDVLQAYIRQGMKFFVAKVNLETFEQGQFQTLRPLQIAYESHRYLLPIRLGMVNAQAPQDLIVYILSPQGQAELTNYRTVPIPTNVEIPLFVKAEFADFYGALFTTAHDQENRKVAFLEYAWDMANCDPCAANPLSQAELREAGVFWLDNNSTRNNPTRSNSTQNNVFITRLHLRYSRDTFPEDLQFQSTGNRQLFQGRYILRHPAPGNWDCPAAQTYKQQLQERHEREAQTLARLTGWDLTEIYRKMPEMEVIAEPTEPWWQNLWR
jgi:hypothetical protein